MTAQEQARLALAIRKAIERSTLARYEIAKQSGVEESSISRFMSGKRSLSLDSIERLAPVLGLEIIARRKKK